MENPNEKWQVDVKGEIYDTTFEELTVWIAEDSLLESDKVRRGNLRWLEAGRVPPLRPFFDAHTNGTEPPAVQMTTVKADAEDEVPSAQSTHNLNVAPVVEQQTESDFNQLPGDVLEGVDVSTCNIHPETASEFICSACSHAFCKECPEGFGASVKICPYCGAMCRAIAEAATENEKEERINRDISEGFGFGDFITAIEYPFRFKTSLIFGGLLVAFLGYGQSAASMGSIFFIAAALICFIFSTAFVFGMISNTLNRFAEGEIESNYIPSFEDFSAWDDVIHPFFLFLGVWIVSFGLMFALAIGLAWYALSSITGDMALEKNAIEKLEKPSDQSLSHIDIVRQKLQRQNVGRTEIVVGQDGLTDAQRNTLEEEAEFQKLNDLANNYRKTQVESTLGPTAEAQQEQLRSTLTRLFKVGGVFLVFILIAFLWGVFYFPAACAVAGYTKSFAAAINPLVGLDTIKHMGLDYFKILLMTFAIWFVSAVVAGILGLLLSPFDMPGFGNIPAKFIASFTGFYFTVVFAVVLGRALYKNSAKLKLYR